MKEKTLISGDVNEIQSILAFTKRGYEVSIPFSGSCRYDLIVDINGNLIRIQCKSSRSFKDDHSSIIMETSRSTMNTQNFSRYKYNKNEIDYFYTYYNGYDFLIPVEDVDEKEIVLRLKSPKNNQIDKVNIASDYLLDNVLESLINDKPIKKFIDNFIYSIDTNTNQKEEWSIEKLKNNFSDRQLRWIRESILSNKIAYNKH